MIKNSLQSKAASTIGQLPGLMLFSGILLCLLLISQNISGQEKISISQPEVNFSNNRLIIRYNILGAEHDDLFKVDLLLTDSTGARINAISLFGDVGEDIHAKGRKQIIWDLAADEVVLNKGVAVEIKAALIEPPKLVVDKPEEILVVDPEPIEDEEAVEVTPIKEKSRNGLENKEILSIMLKSAALPGLGQSQLSDGKPYWILGAAGYGCIAGSVYLNQRAKANYNTYLESEDPELFNSSFTTGKKQYTTSRILGWSAVVLWAADLGLTWMKFSKPSPVSGTGNKSTFRLASGYDQVNRSQSISLLYTF